jgi:hypothetical protein
MSDLTSIEKLRLERFFGMGSGYVLDFSNRTFDEFIIDNTRLNIYADKYSYGSGSKANRLRAFWDKESNYLTGKLIGAVLEYWKTQCEINSREFDMNAYNECLKIADRLKQDLPIDNIEILHAETEDRDFNLLAKTIKEIIEKNEPEAGLDRLHTFVFKYIRQLCYKHQITILKDDPLHSVFGKYIKHLTTNNLLESAMAERILKSSISVLEAFNDVRNNKSFAHDNPILNYRESLLIFNSITNTIKFIESIEETVDEKNKQTKTENEWDELPF